MNLRSARVAPERRTHHPLAEAFLSGGSSVAANMKTYKEKLLDPRWQRRRLEILSRSDFHCESCLDEEKTLHVHHKRYVKGREPWEYGDHELSALCSDCHELEGDAREMLEIALCCIRPTFMDWTGFVAMVAGYLTQQAGVLSDQERKTLSAIGLTWANDELAFLTGRQAVEEIGNKRRARLDKKIRDREMKDGEA
jgi:hypothetical protein